MQLSITNIEDKFNAINEKNPTMVKLRLGVSVDNLGLLVVNSVQLEYEYVKVSKKTKTVTEEEYNANKDKYTFVSNVEEKPKADDKEETAPAPKQVKVE